MFKKILAAATLIIASLALISCSKNTPSGKKYTDKSNNMDNAVSAVEAADTKTDGLSDIAYEMFYKIVYTDSTGDTILGTKSTFSVSKKGTENVSALISKTLYGTESSTKSVFAYKNGSAYVKMYASDFAAKSSYDDFCTFVENQSYTTDETFLDLKHFSKATSYTLEDGSSEIVFYSSSTELLSLIAKFIGLSSSDYVYNITDTSLTVNLTPNGELSDKHLTFVATYYEEDTPEKKVVYKGDFSYTVEKTSDVTVNMPSGYSDAQSISSLSLLKKFSSGYIVLASIQDLDATYDRYIKNSDSAGNVYELHDKVHFTEGYKDGKYLYGSIDERYLFLCEKAEDEAQDKTEESTTSKGMFIGSDGKYYSRSSSGEEKNGTEPPNSDEDFISMVYSTLSGEMVSESEITKMKITETDETVTFTYSLSDDTIPSYSEYLFSAFIGNDAAAELGLSNFNHITVKNTGVITIRKSDGCIISHEVSFDVTYYGNTTYLNTKTEFKMTVNATGSDVDILDVSDWGDHSFGDQ